MKIEEERLEMMRLEMLGVEELELKARDLESLDCILYAKNPFASQECFNFIQIMENSNCNNACCKIKSDFIQELRKDVQTCGGGAQWTYWVPASIETLQWTLDDFVPEENKNTVI